MLGFAPLGQTTLGEVPVFYRITPDADDTDGLWTNELSATTLYTSIDETANADADYIQSASMPSSDLCKVALSDPTGTGTVTPAEPMSVHYRFKKSASGGTFTLRVRLLEGTTPIATWTESSVSDSYTYVEHTLTAAEFASITDFTNLYLDFQADAP